MEDSSSTLKKIVASIVVVGIIALAIFLIVTQIQKPDTVQEESPEEATGPVYKVIGTSVEGRDIESYTYGTGDTHLAFVGGIHGGYEWNSVLLAYRIMDYFDEHPESIPNTLSISIIPSANPDGVYKIIGKEGRFALSDVPVGTDQSSGRFNARGVDLNRNFACKWQPESSWRGETVSAGTSAFSEPEAIAIKTFVENTTPDLVVFWHSQANTVYASECQAGVLPATLTAMNTYADVTGYNRQASFDAYAITGDAEGWLASIGIPAITVELVTHESVEFEKNLKGVEALLQLYK